MLIQSTCPHLAPTKDVSFENHPLLKNLRALGALRGLKIKTGPIFRMVCLPWIDRTAELAETAELFLCERCALGGF